MTAADYPVLRLSDRDRRWHRTRAFMTAQGFDCLLVFGLKGRERFDGYLANESLDGLVVFPLSAEPVYLTWTHHRITRRMASNMADIQFWITDVRVGPFGPGIVTALTELGLADDRIGVVGLASQAAGELDGIVPYRTWDYVLANLPGASFADCSLDFARMMMPKTPQEQELVRFAAAIGEEACQVMLEVTRPGVREAEIYAAVLRVLHTRSATTVAPHLIISVGADDPGWGPPYWTYAGGPSRTIAPGDLVQAEIFPVYGGFEAQSQMSIAVEPVPRVLHELHDIARYSYDAGLAALRPGAGFIEVATAMAAPLLEAGRYNMTPMLHSLSPAAFVGHIALNASQIPGYGRYPGFRTIEPAHDVQLGPGMVFAFEPNACTGLHRVNIGGTVVVGEQGPIELNTTPCRMHVVS
jgi:Xaa-Pro aminopeptidase